jgi:hypothetical protein
MFYQRDYPCSSFLLGFNRFPPPDGKMLQINLNVKTEEAKSIVRGITREKGIKQNAALRGWESGLSGGSHVGNENN